VIVAGGGVIFSHGQSEAVALAEQLGAPVVASYLHNDSFPNRHELYCGPLGYQGSKAAMRVLQQADVVLALGTRLGPFGTLPQYGIEYWPKGARIVQVDPDHRMIGLTKKIDVGVVGDARAAAAELLSRLQNQPLAGHANRAERLAEVRRQKAAWEAELAGISSAEGSPIAPRRALRELERAMPATAMVTTDIGNVCSVANSYLRFDAPNSFFAAMSFGNCGYAFPTAMGAKVAAPERPAVAYVGDGAWGMSLNEVLTCVRERIPATAVVFNNGQWGAEKKNQIDYYADRYVGTNLVNPSFAGIARAMGANGITVDAPDQIGDALREATAADLCTVLEIKLTQELGEPFRRDALKKPKRFLAKYKAYEVA
jgi:sulfoacetaldehyde acetyltransferase